MRAVWLREFGGPEVLVPGELEAKTKRHRLRERVPIEPATWEVLQQVLDRFHLAIEFA